jgi:hypothetical protein
VDTHRQTGHALAPAPLPIYAFKHVCKSGISRMNHGSERHFTSQNA